MTKDDKKIIFMNTEVGLFLWFFAKAMVIVKGFFAGHYLTKRLVPPFYLVSEYHQVHQRK